MTTDLQQRYKKQFRGEIIHLNKWCLISIHKILINETLPTLYKFNSMDHRPICKT